MSDRAAKPTGKNRTDFVVSAAKQSAEEELLDRTCLSVDQTTCKAFLARLDTPAAPNERVKRLLRTTPPWKR